MICDVCGLRVVFDEIGFAFMRLVSEESVNMDEIGF